MQSNNHFDHPTEETLERFVLRRSCEDELETVETHILACEPCVARLEALEIEVAATKLALQKMQSERAEKAVAKERTFRSSWFSSNWFSMPSLSMAGAVAALVIGVFLLPQALHRNTAAADVTLSAYRGLETTSVPAGRPLRFHLNASGLADGLVSIQVVDAAGSQLWKGSAAVQHDQVEVNIPRIADSGSHFLRLYREAPGAAEGELIREFAFQVH